MAQYALGVDVAEGVAQDASCIIVIDVTKGLHVATFWDNLIDVDNFAVEIYKAGNFYNKAAVCVESNNHGKAVLSLLGGAVGGFAYSNLYRRYEFDSYRQVRTKTLGFLTNSQTKPRIIENLKSALKTGEILTHDKSLILELSAFIRDERGRLGSKGSDHDDRVMAFALAWEQARLLIENRKITQQYESRPQSYDPNTGFPTNYSSSYENSDSSDYE